MDRPLRRSRQRLPPSGLIGLLPQEEAAIKRALQQSLQDEKKKTLTRHRQSTTATSHSSFSFFSNAASTSALPKRVDSQDLLELEGSVDPTDVPSGSSLPQKRRRLHSPLSPSRSLDSFSSESKPSSPIRGNGGLLGRATSSSSLSSPRSVESSLKLVLSPTSWSRSSSSSWSPTPEPSTGTTLGRPSKKAAANSKKYQKLSPKAKPAAVIETQPKRKRGRPRKYPPKETQKASPKLDKTGKPSPGLLKAGRAPKTYTKVALQYHGAKIAKRRQQQQGVVHRQGRDGQGSAQGMLRPMSPEAAMALHDHCYSDQNIMERGDDGATDVKSISRSSPYAAQRKFAHNQAPNTTPTRLSRAEVEGVSQVKEIPKTEDFITFLCLRGSDSLPKELEKFTFPWTQLQRRRQREARARNVARKLGDSIATSSPVSFN